MLIHSLGTGGAFDVRQKNSSFLLRQWPVLGNCLLDCGYSVYTALRNAKLENEIDYVFITHTHDDHIGSLSTLIYDRYFLHKRQTVIVTSPEVFPLLNDYLYDICGHSTEQMHIILPEGLKGVYSIDTTGRHKPGFPSCGFVFDSDRNVFILSGDIAEPIFPLFKEQLPEIYESMGKKKSFCLHDVTSVEAAANVHCHHLLLKPYRTAVNTLYGYHHNLQDAVQIQEKSKIRSIITKKDSE